MSSSRSRCAAPRSPAEGNLQTWRLEIFASAGLERILSRLILDRHEDIAARRVEILRQLVLPVEHVVPPRSHRPVAAQGVARREIEQAVAVHLGARGFARGIEARAACDDFGSDPPGAGGVAERQTAVFSRASLQ